MKWRDRRQSRNIEDRRGGGKAGGIGLGSVVIAVILWALFDVDPSTTLGVANQVSNATQSSQSPTVQTKEQIESKEFVATILADTEDVWTSIFQQAQKRYIPPKLVLFSGSVQSACGGATSASGPFYCPADQKVYLDTQFFVDMRQQMNITGELNENEFHQNHAQAADFAQAYVIAHEVGHHVQTLLGISQKVREAQAVRTQVQANELSVRQELQADCFAGLWANHNHARTGFLSEGDIEEALDAAEKIGDDYLQHQAHGHIVPDSFTHGTSDQRKRWFYTGFQTGDINACDTFSAKRL